MSGSGDRNLQKEAYLCHNRRRYAEFRAGHLCEFDNGYEKGLTTIFSGYRPRGARCFWFILLIAYISYLVD